MATDTRQVIGHLKYRVSFDPGIGSPALLDMGHQAASGSRRAWPACPSPLPLPCWSSGPLVHIFLQSKNAPHSQGEYDVYSTFQSHEPEFDYLKSLEIEEKINKIKWLPQQNAAHSLLSTNGEGPACGGASTAGSHMLFSSLLGLSSFLGPENSKTVF